nr:unnamed protein product [Callosobruchus chinensis]
MINQFGDLTDEEFKEMMTMERPEFVETPMEFEGDGDVPDSVDWRKVGAVTDAGAVEGQVFIHNKTLESLSPQNLVDCAGEDYNTSGCRGGWQTEAFKYVRDHGILTEKEYPYKGVDNRCRKKATKGPVSATFDMSGLRFYHDGVLDSKHCKSSVKGLNHAVLLVGYEKDYYIAKNSWGPNWAAFGGYFYILRNNNTCGISLLNSFPIMSLSDQEAWEQFKIEHGKTYRSLSEDRDRFSIFQSNLRFIEDHNDRFSRGEESYSMMINRFGDLTDQEFKEMMTMERPESVETLVEFDGEGDIPDSVDWRKVGAVTDVKNQELCKSCWAFRAVEGQVFIHNKTLESLSPQNLLDCARGQYRSFGCAGGWQTEAFKYVRDHGILTEKEYPYKGVDNRCKKRGGVKISKFARIRAGDEVSLTHAIANKGPIAATLDLSGLKFYHNGVLDSKHCNSTEDDLNHAILLVGYEKNYYIAKNSWGQDWALGGYFNILRDNNTCGISLFNSFPILVLLVFLQIEHGKTYRSLSEDRDRFSIFQSNLRSLKITTIDSRETKKAAA